MNILDMMKDITTSNSNGYHWTLGRNGMGWKPVRASAFPYRVGNAEIREGYETPGMQAVIPDVGEIVAGIVPWADVLAGPEVVGYHRDQEIYVLTTEVTEAVLPVYGYSFPMRTTTILFNTAMDMRDYHHAVYRVCWRALEKEIRRSYVREFLEELTHSITVDGGDPSLRRLAANERELREIAFAVYMQATLMQADFLDGEGAPMHEQVFRDAKEGILGQRLAALRNPLSHLTDTRKAA